MNRLLTFQYYFTTRPDPNFQYTKITVAAIAILLLVALGITIYRNKYATDKALKKTLKKYPTPFSSFAGAILFLLLTREAGIPIFAMRIWWIIILAWLAYFTLKSLIRFKSDYQSIKTKSTTKNTRSKYIPKKKTKRKKKLT